MPNRLSDVLIESLEGRLTFNSAAPLIPSLDLPWTNPSLPVTLDGKGYFLSGTSISSANLYCTDGTAAGTVSISQSEPKLTAVYKDSERPVVVGSKMFLNSNNHLWVSDGTETGTHQLPGITEIYHNGDWWYSVHDGKIYVVSPDSSHRLTLYESDGTDAGTRAISAGQATLYGLPTLAGFSGSAVYFTYTLLNGESTSTLYRYDGTSTAAVMPLNTGHPGAAAIDLNDLNRSQKIYAAITDKGYRLYVSDLTVAGTRPVDTSILYVGGLNVLNGVAYFYGSEPNGSIGLYRTDGTHAGTTKLVALGSGSQGAYGYAESIVFAGKLYMRPYNLYGDGSVYAFSPDGSVQPLLATSLNTGFVVDANQLWIDGTRAYVTANAPTTVQLTDGAGAADAELNGKFLFVSPYSRYSGTTSTSRLYVWDSSGPFTGTLGGHVYSDPDSNGAHTSGELSIPGVTVYLDLNRNGVYDAGIDRSTVTDSDGSYTFNNAPLGQWTVAAIAQPSVLTPELASTATVSAGQLTTSDLLVSYGTRLAGIVYTDANANGQQDPGETGLAGVQVFIDSNPTATTAASGDLYAVTDAQGRYFFNNINNAHGYLRVASPGTTYSVVQPSFATDSVAGTVGIVPGPPIAVTPPTAVQVNFQADVNGDGLQTAADAISSTFQVFAYIDLNRNGVVDTGEPSGFVSNGAYLYSVPAGQQLLRVIPPQGWSDSLTTDSVEINPRSATVLAAPTFTLTPQAPPNAVVHGNVAEDVDFSHTLSSGDTPIALLRIWDDADTDGVLDSGEAYTYSAANGDYALTALPAGTRRIAFSSSAGYVPASGLNYYFNADTTSPVTQNLPLYATSRQVRVSGQVRFDENNNGVLDSTDPPLRAVAVTSALWPTPFVTDAQGRFVATATSGKHTPAITLLPGYTTVSTVAPPTLTAGQTFDTALILVKGPNPQLGVISGVVFQDDNLNGIRDTGEIALKDVQVWADVDRNGVRSNEPVTRTAADGSYSLTGLPPGTVDVYVTLTAPAYATRAPGNKQTVTLDGNDLSGVNFGINNASPVSGYVFIDYNSNGVRDPFDTARAGVRVWADLNGDGVLDSATEPFTTTNSSGGYTLSGLAPNSAATIYIDPPSGFSTVGARSQLIAAGTPGQTRQASFAINNGTAVIAGRVFFDGNKNGLPDTGELQGNQTVTLTDPATGNLIATTATSTTDYYFRFSNLQPGTYKLNYTSTVNDTLLGNGGLIVTVYAGDVSTGSLLSWYPKPETFTGTVYLDPNNNSGDNYPDADDVPAVGVRAFLDLDHDKIYDPGEPFGLTDASGVFTVSAPYQNNGNGYVYLDALVVENPTGYLEADNYRYPLTVSGNATSNTNVGTFLFAPPKGLTITGYVYEDRNTNGVRDPGEPGIPYVGVGSDFTPYTGDVKFTDRNGYYVYHVENSSDSPYYLRTSLTAPYLATDGGGFKATLQSTTADFGFVAWRLGGYAFNDANGNGVRDAGETPVVGRRVWIDSDHDGVFDNGETSTLTASDGFYSFADIGGGDYRIAEEMPNGQPAATLDVDLAEGHAQGGLSFANPVVNQVTDVAIDDGTGQQSGVRSITVTFDGAVNAGSFEAGAFTLTAAGTPSLAIAVSVDSITPVAGGKTAVRLIFAGSGVTAGSLPDGRYTLSINGNQITGASGLKIDAAGNGVTGSVRSIAFNRLFGDLTGDNIVNFNDFLALQAAFGTHLGDSHYVAGLDGDGSGAIDFTDFLLFQANFGRVLAATGRIVKTDAGTLPTLLPPAPVKTASISGMAFGDVNRNGKYDNGDIVAAGRTVWLDLDNDGTKDVNEPSTLTDIHGNYTFNNLTAGAYRVRRVFPKGFIESTPARIIQLASAQAARNVQIGSKAK